MNLTDKKWRLNNLYRIIDKSGCSVPLKLNEVQENVLNNLHNRNLILKARQLGMSTFSVLYILDEVLFSQNLTAGIVSYSLEHAQHIFKKIIGHALDTLPSMLKPLAGVINRSAREITLSNGGSIRVDTTLRGGSYPLVLVSEFGKTCARNPVKAEEVITGTLQTVSHKGTVIIESTGEGNEGYFAEMVYEARRRGNDNLSELEYKLFFYPWMLEPSYRSSQPMTLTPDDNDYFKKVEEETGFGIDESQRNWYLLQAALLGDKMQQEFPSTVSEAFLASSDAFYFAKEIAKCFEENRCINTSIIDSLSPIYAAMDIGVNDTTVIIFFQLCHGEIRIFDFYADNDKDVDYYANFLRNQKPYLYDTIFLPHDSRKRNISDITNTFESDFRRLFSNTGTKFVVLPKMDKQIQISHARLKLKRCVFNISKVKKLIDQLSNYKKKWSESLGKYLEDPYHNDASNYADAYQYLCQAVSHLEAYKGISGALDKHRQIVDARIRKI